MVVADHKFHTECFSCGNCQRFLEEEDDYVLLERHRLLCDLCFTREQKQPWWGASLHAVHHFHLTTTEAAKHKIEIETVKGEIKRHLQPEGVEKEPQSSIMIKGYNASLKQRTYEMSKIRAGDLVLEVNRVVVSATTVDRVAALLTTKPDEITQITIERNTSGLQMEPRQCRLISTDSDSEPDSPSDEKSFRNRSISLFSRRDLRRCRLPSTENHAVQNGEVDSLKDGSTKKTSKAVRSNSLPRSNSLSDSLKVRSPIHRAQSFKEETVTNRVFRPCDLVLGDVIGKGFFGQVRKVTQRQTGEVMVLKELLNYDEEANTSFLKEVALLKSLDHPNVLRFIGVLYRDQTLNLITEYISGGTVRQVLKDKGKQLSWSQRVKFAKDIATGMAYLHSMNVMHRDLNSKNCLVETDKESGEMSAVVADFGLARVVRDRPLSPMNRISSTLPPSPGRKLLCVTGNRPPPPKKRYTVVGSPYWMAPEMLMGMTYNEKVDVFSFGIVMCEIIGRVKADPDFLPRKSNFGLDEEKFCQEFCEECPELFYRIAFLCCDLDSDKRPEFCDLEKWLESLLLHLEVGLPLSSDMQFTLLPATLMRKSARVVKGMTEAPKAEINTSDQHIQGCSDASSPRGREIRWSCDNETTRQLGSSLRRQFWSQGSLGTIQAPIYGRTKIYFGLVRVKKISLYIFCGNVPLKWVATY
ncbi:LIM domain kinase 1 [Desmophyllum pertusum]|uniref:non-specific serine/threonine protein kinase n=1 Tax=Desmophyllum pertusum TaxID=174260 RepID=A0A9W9ZTG5_9CNID|nr:LIM domain kinase 1 [Desmophyllum pertusum]